MGIKRIGITTGLILLVAAFYSFFQYTQSSSQISPLTDVAQDNEGGPQTVVPHELSIQALKNGTYPGSQLLIEETLPPGSNYQRYIASYQSEGYKIYGLLTVPDPAGDSRLTKPENGWPVVIFNHGYIPPAQYRSTERYIAYTDAFSRAGYVLFRPDYRGHGNSEGPPTGAYGSNGYTIDVLNAFASVKQLPYVDSSRMGMWGHSMGGYITLRAMVVNPEIKAGVIWAGVVGSYADMLNNWRRRTTPSVSPTGVMTGNRGWRQALVQQFGEPEQNPTFWNSISANAFLTDISGPLQIHHGTADSSVPVAFSETLKKQMDTAGKPAELFIYAGDDHDITANFGTAMRRSVEFFDTHLAR